MPENRPLSRRQLRNVQTARGLPAAEVKHRTGMPSASYDAVFGVGAESEEGKEPNKMVSQVTFERLIALLGIDAGFDTLRSVGVLEWRSAGTGGATPSPWQEAVVALVTELFSDDLLMVEISTEVGRSGWYKRAAGSERMVLLHDRQNGFRIAITEASHDLAALLESAIGVACEKRYSIPANEFKEAREMIRHEVFRSVQFDALSGALAAKYSWRDVQAAAREFGFLPDDLIEMMHNRAQERAAGQPVEQNAPAPRDQEYGVRRLQVVN